jgi:NTE family protein
VPDTILTEGLVHGSPRDPAAPEPGIALCLSGGGYRAMLFHVGALWRLNELGYLPRLARISSVSSGSLAAALLGLKWPRLGFDSQGVAAAFPAEVVAPLRALARRPIDVCAILVGLLPFTSVNARLIAAFRRHLYGEATLQDLPERPRFVINATNIQSGALWRFSRPYMRDYLVGEVRNPKLGLADAVAASSAFPPFLSPARIAVERRAYSPLGGEPLHSDEYLLAPVLSDGGVYDNLGLETAWKRYDTILVSDAGLHMPPAPRPALDWLRHTRRVLDVIDNQVRSLRKRQLVHAFGAGERKGTYWGIRSHIADYGLSNPLPAAPERVLELATVPTRLAPMPLEKEERLINWGYAICDTAIRTWIDRGAAPPPGFPYPARGV